MKNNLYRGKGFLCPESLLLITIKKEKPSGLAPSLPSGYALAEADHVNISDQKKGVQYLGPSSKTRSGAVTGHLSVQINQLK
ncbi:MAG TPA: hypothetical protein VFG54_04300 [Prolixibacteraceae bacterium]|nr:hypothetical protein [Prolixibacteraceae bacterium]